MSLDLCKALAVAESYNHRCNINSSANNKWATLWVRQRLTKSPCNNSMSCSKFVLHLPSSRHNPSLLRGPFRRPGLNPPPRHEPSPVLTRTCPVTRQHRNKADQTSCTITCIRTSLPLPAYRPTMAAA